MGHSTVIKSLLWLIFITLFHSNPLLVATSIHEILPQFGFPSGLFPDSVKNYSFSPRDGSFVVELVKQPCPCYVLLGKDEYLLSYDEIISGTLRLASITNLEGVQIKWYLIWLKVNEIKVDLPPNDNIYLQFGLFNKKLDVHQFQTIHSCTSFKEHVDLQGQCNATSGELIKSCYHACLAHSKGKFAPISL